MYYFYKFFFDAMSTYIVWHGDTILLFKRTDLRYWLMKMLFIGTTKIY